MVKFGYIWRSDVQLDGSKIIHQVRKHGNLDGVIIFLKQNLGWKYRSGLCISCKDVSSLSVETLNKCDRPLEENLTSCKNYLQGILSKNTGKDVFLAGDFYVILLDFENKRALKTYYFILALFH